MPSPESRARLAARQAELAKALMGQSALPLSFDAVQLESASAALARKRARGVVKAWPILARDLGERFGAEFAAFAAANPLPQDGGAFADGLAFAHHLKGKHGLSDVVRAELWTIDLRLARRRCALRTCWLRAERRLIIGIRLPWLGMHTLSISLG